MYRGASVIEARSAWSTKRTQNPSRRNQMRLDDVRRIQANLADDGSVGSRAAAAAGGPQVWTAIAVC
eukprot:CAMPEP_0115847634 /NCGR_PEP_ID=MMETSP0287-20121206/10484_1 /TAXON_ID=412157 /ORGANISM="Chrysochromulina rotalis, Strain UIO044" /LENGTH=66 /DNA_ID=CAMNT_0003301475 /DNA_START=374 /DNA_END=574 /DNA_ORIENTATION=-